MSVFYSYTKSGIINYLVDNLGFSEETAECVFDNLEDYEEKAYKRNAFVSGYIHDESKDVYYLVTFESNYDYGPSDFYLYTTPKKKIVKEVVVKKTTFVDAV